MPRATTRFERFCECGAHICVNSPRHEIDVFEDLWRRQHPIGPNHGPMSADGWHAAGHQLSAIFPEIGRRVCQDLARRQRPAA